MDQTDETVEVKENSTSKLLPMIFILLVVVGLVLVANWPKGKDASKAGSVEQATPTQTITQVADAKYKDGQYDVTGNYLSPGGDESIEVKVTLKDNLIVDSEVISKAERPNSVKFQGQFIEGYKDLVVGKNISEVKLDKVSGSSLTPKGFNDAIEKIKAEAKV